MVEVERGGEVASKRPDRIAIGKLGVAHLTSSDMELSLSCSQCTTLRLAPVGKAIPRAARQSFGAEPDAEMTSNLLDLTS